MSVEKAVSFAASMIRNGQYIGTALNIAANYYKVPRADVQRGLASRSGRSQKGRARKQKPIRKCCNCDNEAVWHCTYYYGFNSGHHYTCESCGQEFPAHHEDKVDSYKWTRYIPTKNTKEAKESGNSDG